MCKCNIFRPPEKEKPPRYVRVDFLGQVVLGEIKRLTKFASRGEDDFIKAVMGITQQNIALNRKYKEKELAALQARDEELDGLFERIYEDNVSSKLSDDRFAKMSRRYENEQKEISEKIKLLRAEMDKRSSKFVTADMFIPAVRKYTRAKALTPRMLNELIDHIEVHQTEKNDGIWEQYLVIHYSGGSETKLVRSGNREFGGHNKYSYPFSVILFNRHYF